MTNFRQHRFHVLDGMRGIAAVVVMLSHYSEAYDLKIFHSSAIAVDVFFILSGFVISHAYAEKLLTGMTAAEFTIRRVARLFPMMALGLVIGSIALCCLYTVNISDIPPRQIIVSFLENLIFLPSLRDGSGSAIAPADSPLWSIFFELLASLGFLVLVRVRTETLTRTYLSCLPLVFLIAAANTFVGHGSYIQPSMGFNTANFIGGFPRVFYGFGCGMVMYRLRTDNRIFRILKPFRKLLPTIPAVLYAALGALILFPVAFKGLYYFFAVGLIAPTLVIQGSLATCRSKFMLLGSEFIGWLSYPLYCVHVPVFMMMKAADASYHVFQTGTLEIQVASVLVSVALASIAGFIFDKYQVQRYLADLLRSVIRVPG